MKRKLALTFGLLMVLSFGLALVPAEQAAAFNIPPAYPIPTFNLSTPTPVPGIIYEPGPLKPLPPGIIPTPTPTPAPGTIYDPGPLKPLPSGLVPTPTPTPAPGTIYDPGPLKPLPSGLVRTPSPAPKPTAKPTQKPKQPTKKPAQTKALSGAEMTSFGLYFEELRPKLTDKWYMFTPLDLSVDGVLNYPLVAENAHIVGTLRVTVGGGHVKVESLPAEGVKPGRQFFTFFGNLDQVQTVTVSLLEAMAQPFNQEINIQNAFGDDRKVILYLNSTVDFDPQKASISPFVPDQHRIFMQNLVPLLD